MNLVRPSEERCRTRLVEGLPGSYAETREVALGSYQALPVLTRLLEGHVRLTEGPVRLTEDHTRQALGTTRLTDGPTRLLES